ncbi:bifunctional riboflavin kinase/FAD synthetase [Sphingomonas nostoxanthinifaciens]|uniref:bifunctional riboflavin kinase/FAD synthetase n=1 Tax=Sphingomonas nostoxanthinifaciens TaxID=2872652 RepID=UPI001CC1F07D|nr:bifunctional riboflavin kinase/FAD synthetase [Sphingomonas nostoxanthinifaciens]UAK24892.1 bifunctional riboflavin kinase/FAD synthetase [Sphingomonas nostoxanthinifaciens]
MRLIASDMPLPPALRGAVIALGNFDGFHRGHQAVVGRAVARARAEGRPAIVATFDPHPARFFRPETPPFALTTMNQRAALFAEAGVDATLVLRFDAALAVLSPQAFVEDLLVGRFGAAGVVTGEDFTFGRDRAGSPAVLAALGAPHGLVAETVAPVADADGTISSTRIRAALRAGDCATAARLLTRPFAIEGSVVHGAALGRTIGYPTANVTLGDYARPRYGIYAVRVRLDDGRMVDGAANLGIRPSFDPPLELLEPYLFDFSGDLYGRTIAVALIAFLRPEAKFDTLDALVAQMARDCDEAREILGRLD